MQVKKFARNVVLWMIPSAVVWVLLTGFYNHFLMVSTENLLHVFERPDVTRLERHPQDAHYAAILRTDFPPAKSRVYSMRVTDLHYHLVLLAALFLAVPGIPWRQRLGNLGLAVLVTICFDIVLFFFWVKFAYATQLGTWSTEHYGPFAQNFFGLGKHLLDLPFKLALPLTLWVAFYYDLLRHTRRER